MPADGRGRKQESGPVPAVDLGKLREVDVKSLAVRFLLGAAISVAAGIIAKTVGPRLGGAFLAFPSILPASLTLIQQRDGTRDADRDAVGAVLGGLGLAVFATIGETTFGRLPAVAVLLLALGVWLASSFALYALLAVMRPDDCDKAQD